MDAQLNALLWEWGTALKDCERRREEIRSLMAQAEDADLMLKAQVLTAMPKGNTVSDPTAAAAVMREKSLERVTALTEEINQVMLRKERIDRAVAALPERLQTLLTLRYKHGLSLHIQIPARMHIAERTAFRWLALAFEKLAENGSILGL